MTAFDELSGVTVTVVGSESSDGTEVGDAASESDVGVAIVVPAELPEAVEPEELDELDEPVDVLVVPTPDRAPLAGVLLPPPPLQPAIAAIASTSKRLRDDLFAIPVLSLLRIRRNRSQ